MVMAMVVEMAMLTAKCKPLESLQEDTKMLDRQGFEPGDALRFSTSHMPTDHNKSDSMMAMEFV